MVLEEIRLTHKKAALTIHIIQFCLYEKFTRDKEARERETEVDFRDGIGPLGVVKRQIPSDPLVVQEEGQRHFHKCPQSSVQGTWRKQGPVNPDSLAGPLC